MKFFLLFISNGKCSIRRFRRNGYYYKKTYSYLGNMIDKQMGYSVGRAVHRQIFQEQKIVR